MHSQVALTVIVPVYNEAQYIAHALESVLWQRVDFEYEIIVVDDCSTDDTCNIVAQYQAKYPQVRLERNPENKGKGYSFMRAYSLARGKYFHVLDGDDYFVNFNKLRIQKEFLDNNEDYFAVCHNSVRVFLNDEILLERPDVDEITCDYERSMKQDFYAHTSTFMFRKIGDTLPEYFLKQPMRGDSGCFFYHAYKSKGLFKYLPMIGSVYYFHNEGIWSSLAPAGRKKIRLDMLDVFMDDIIQDNRSPEWELVKNRRDVEEAQEEAIDRRKRTSREDMLQYCWNYASTVFRPDVREISFQGMHSLNQVDALCEIVGRTVMHEQKILLKDRVYKPKTVVLALSGLVPNGGGIAKQIKELVSIYLNEGWHVHIVCSNTITTTTPEIVETYLDQEGVTFWYGDNTATKIERVSALIKHLAEYAPERIHPYITHNDVVLNAAIQRGLGQEVVVDYVYDHGTSLGLFNSAIDCIIAKTESQANALSKVLGRNTVVYNPPFLKDKHNGIRYVPPTQGEPINTASAAARNYKVETPYDYPYADAVLRILRITGGKHFHYGPLSEEFLFHMGEMLERNNLPLDRFVHIPWADDFSGDLLDKKVHLFLAPFPVCSARIVIEVMSAGIPVLNHVNVGAKLPQSSDFTGNSQLRWRNYFDLYSIIVSLTPENLGELSRNARAYYEENNEFERNKHRFIAKASKPFDGIITPEIILRDVAYAPYYDFSDDLFRYNKEELHLVKKVKKKKTLVRKIKNFYRKWSVLYKLEVRLAVVMYTCMLIVARSPLPCKTFNKEKVERKLRRKMSIPYNMAKR